MIRASKKFEGAFPLGIEDELYASAGDHIAYFWESDADFERAVKFAEIGLRQQDAVVIFGWDEANDKVLSILRSRGLPIEQMLQEGRLSVMGAESSGQATLQSIGSIFRQLIERGSTRLRLLGNIGWGKSGWPDEDDLLAFESKVTGAIADLPCVVVCMYDVRSLSGRVILHGAFETHPLTFCRNILRENTNFVPFNEFMAPKR